MRKPEKLYVENGTVGETVSRTKFPVSTSDVKIELPGVTSGAFLDEGIEMLEMDISNKIVYLKGNWLNRRVLENNSYLFLLKRANLKKSLRFVKLFHAVTNSQASTKVVLADTVTSQELFDFVGPSGSPSVIGKAVFSLLPQNVNPPNTLSFGFAHEKTMEGSAYGAKLHWKNTAEVNRNVLRWRAVPRVKRETILAYQVAQGGTYTVLPSAFVSSEWGSGESLSVQGKIVSVDVLSGGEFMGVPSLSAFWPGADGASFSLGMSGNSLQSVTVVTGGTGYNSTPIFSFSGATVVSSPTLKAHLGIAEILTESRGYDYVEIPTFSLRGGSGEGGSVTVSLNVSNEGTVDFVTVLQGGSGYVDKSSLVFSGGGGIGAQGYVNVSDGEIVSAVIVEGGYGYTSAPIVGVTGNGASASMVATVSLYSDWNYVEIDPFVPEYTLENLNKNAEYEWQVYSSTAKRDDLNSFSPSLKFKFF